MKILLVPNVLTALRNLEVQLKNTIKTVKHEITSAGYAAK